MHTASTPARPAVPAGDARSAGSRARASRARAGSSARCDRRERGRCRYACSFARRSISCSIRSAKRSTSCGSSSSPISSPGRERGLELVPELLLLGHSDGEHTRSRRSAIKRLRFSQRRTQNTWQRQSASTSARPTPAWPCSRAASRRSSRTPRADGRLRPSSRSRRTASGSSAPPRGASR